MKLWDKGTITTKNYIESFTVGDDRELDMYLAEFDVYGSIAHAIMLGQVRLLSEQECNLLVSELQLILKNIHDHQFVIENHVEDIHSQVELLLTRSLGVTGKKIHTGRSRNDQVLVDIKMFLRSEIEKLVLNTFSVIESLLEKANKHKNILLPGYTHLQIAMPSSFGLWFGAYAESLIEDLESLVAAWELANKNPLGSAAGYGSSFPLDRHLTTKLLGFRAPHFNVVNAQMSRGRTEKVTAQAISNIASTLGKFAMDVCLYMSQNFAFVSLPSDMTTGSSIMPHKKNPDVFEIIRGKCNILQSLPSQFTHLLANLPSGYHRDLQLTKEIIIPALLEISSCLEILAKVIPELQVQENIIKSDIYNYIFSVEEVNKLVLRGEPFREAYKIVGKSIDEGTFTPNRDIHHTHLGSIGYIALDEIRQESERVRSKFNFEEVHQALANLASPQ